MVKKRNYRREYDSYQGKPEQIKRRSSRNKARRKLMKLGRAKIGDGLDVSHENNSPTDNSIKNLKMKSKHTNRREPRLRKNRRKK